MAKQKGSDVLLKCDTTGTGNFVTVGGIQSNRISIRKGTAEVTNQGSPGKWRELLEGAGITSMSFSGSGTLDTDAPTSTVLQYALNGTIRNWQAIIPGVGTFQGPFQLPQFELTGQHERDVTFDVTGESAGLIALT